MKKTLSIVAIAMVVAFSSDQWLRTAEAQSNVSEQQNAQDKLERVKQLGLRYLQDDLQQKAVESSSSDFEVKSISSDETDISHVRVQQKFDNIPVWQGEVIVHVNPDDSLFAITDDLIVGIQVNTTPVITAQDAIASAVRLKNCSDCQQREMQPDLWVFKHQEKDHLVYRVQLREIENTNDPHKFVYFIDAHTGEEVFSYDSLQTQSATGTGSSLYSETQRFTTFRSIIPHPYLYLPIYDLENVDRRLGTFNYNNSWWGATSFRDPDNIWNSFQQRAAVDAHWGAEKTHEYYQNVHGRNGIDGSGGCASGVLAVNGTTPLLASYVHYDSNYNDAFWEDCSIRYGDGDGFLFSPLVSLDTVAHEMTHGVTQFSVIGSCPGEGLCYVGESGAINESMSDVFGAMVERYVKRESPDTWKVGEQIYTPASTWDALRFIKNPHDATRIEGPCGPIDCTADDDPDHYSERYTGYKDNGGVHINSGIANKAFYLVAKGGTHHKGGSMLGIGADKAAKIWYKALTGFMTSGTDFAGARIATIRAARALYGNGSLESKVVNQAWGMVGVSTFTFSTP